jgi:hypothetical protein
MTTSFIWNMAKKSFTMNTSSSASKMMVMATSRGSIAAAADPGPTPATRPTRLRSTLWKEKEGLLWCKLQWLGGEGRRRRKELADADLTATRFAASTGTPPRHRFALADADCALAWSGEIGEGSEESAGPCGRKPPNC